MSELGELSAEAKSLVELGRDADAPSAGDKQRIKSRLLAELGAGVFVIGAVSTALPATLPAAGAAAPPLAGASTAVRGLWKHALVKAAAAASAVGALYLGAVTLTPSATHPPRPAVRPTPAQGVPTQQSTASTLSPATSELPAEDTATPQPAETQAELHSLRLHAARANSRAAQRALARADEKPGPTARAASTLGAELALLASAQRALREHRPQRALELAQQHATRFGSGSLAEERRGIEALARCQLGDPSHASVASFLATAPSSPLAARVRKECAER